jgi:hypothetical protein
MIHGLAETRKKRLETINYAEAYQQYQTDIKRAPCTGMSVCHPTETTERYLLGIICHISIPVMIYSTRMGQYVIHT